MLVDAAYAADFLALYATGAGYTMASVGCVALHLPPVGVEVYFLLWHLIGLFTKRFPVL